MKTVMFFTFFYLVWIGLILLFSGSGSQYPEVRERFGTIIWHSDDNTSPKETAMHIYCYYPKEAANTDLIIKRADSGDCSNWYGKAILSEGAWVSEREKYWWCDEQARQDTYNCNNS